MEPIKLLKSQNAVIAVLVIALLAQMPHAEAVFYTHGQSHDWLGRIASIAAAIALELAVLVFVVRGSIRASWGFAAFSVAINLVYYYRADATLADLAPTLLLSAGLPIAIALYSHEVAEPITPVQHAMQPPLQEPKPLHIAQPHNATCNPTVQPLHPEGTRNRATVAEPLQADAMNAIATVQEDCNIDPRTRAMQLKSEGLSNARIATELQVNPSTVGRWLKEATR